ncbi:ABC-type uncharacterized transport system, periplasmic component [[Leptolyngbya] sp. PCC 7376]|uniref:ABC transporter substrate-binding protein n=1 Tax=[Leptolyngbya] sp. PCC 7376 TaxID=111781 RepID=UPI00029F3E56|nr:ABC transporter substrate binding protein [[Leptolyngbya] sp. PCC 7376]AFY40309.1 ABC-type uncharacterized transport system, periplasmic component [[Leptolyngbya] sp. PCC 7376]
MLNFLPSLSEVLSTPSSMLSSLSILPVIVLVGAIAPSPTRKIGNKLLRIARHERTFATLFLVILSIFIVMHSLDKPRLLVLHSYETDYTWTTEQIVGIERILERKNSYIIREHFLDTKKKPYKDYMKRAEREVRAIIKQWKPNVIIATDDNAQILAGQHFVDDPRIKIVFTGVQGDLKKYGYTSANNVTGITEGVPPGAIKETLDQINQSLGSDYRKIYFLTHSTTHSKYVVENMKNFDWGDYEMVSASEYETFNDWKSAVSRAENSADILLIGGYKSLQGTEDQTEGGKVVPYETVLEWTEENSSLLKVGARGVYVEDGGMIAVGASPYEQGEEAAKIAVALLDGTKKIEDMPVQESNQYLVYMRESKLREFNPNLRMPKIYEAFARATSHYFE